MPNFALSTNWQTFFLLRDRDSFALPVADILLLTTTTTRHEKHNFFSLKFFGSFKVVQVLLQPSDYGQKKWLEVGAAAMQMVLRLFF